MSSEYRISLWLIPAFLFAQASAQQTSTSQTGPLRIQEQGSFAVAAQ
jgi:hypothetical protein